LVPITPDSWSKKPSENILKSWDTRSTTRARRRKNPWTIPITGKPSANAWFQKQADLGIAVCGSGIGISIAANKVPGIRAALAHEFNNRTPLPRTQRPLTSLALGGRTSARLDKITQLEPIRIVVTSKALAKAFAGSHLSGTCL